MRLAATQAASMVHGRARQLRGRRRRGREKEAEGEESGRRVGPDPINGTAPMLFMNNGITRVHEY